MVHQILGQLIFYSTLGTTLSDATLTQLRRYSLAATAATSQSAAATPRTKFSPPKRKKRDKTVKHTCKSQIMNEPLLVTHNL